MLPLKNRLPIKKEGAHLRRFFASPYFGIKTAANDAGNNRFGIIIPNSAVKKSTQRHFFKRIFIHRLRQWPNFRKDFLFVVYPKINGAQKSELEAEISKAASIVG